MDAQSLFTSIQLNETIGIALDLIYLHQPNLLINRHDLKQLFLIAKNQTQFLLNENFYDQIDGVEMGSPIAPLVFNIFMGHHERNWTKHYNGPDVLFYRRYVDDMFLYFQ